MYDLFCLNFCFYLLYKLHKIQHKFITCRSSYTLDDEDPELDNLPNNIYVSSNAGKDFATANWTEPNASDNSGVVTVSASAEPGSRFYIGTTNVTYNAVDPSGNAAEYTFIVTVAGQYVDLQSLCSILMNDYPFVCFVLFCFIFSFCFDFSTF